MKKSLKIAIGIIAIMVLCLNVSLNMNDNTVDGFNINVEPKTALADDYTCHYYTEWGICHCQIGGYICQEGTHYCWAGISCYYYPEGK